MPDMLAALSYVYPQKFEMAISNSDKTEVTAVIFSDLWPVFRINLWKRSTGDA